MSKYKLEILVPAWKELEEIADYYMLIAGQLLAKKITNRILDALERLEEFPLSCPFVPDSELNRLEYRMLICDKYICIYRLIGEYVYVYHIAHGATEYSNLLK